MTVLKLYSFSLIILLALGSEGSAQELPVTTAVPGDVSDHIVYRILFRHVAAFQSKADAQQSQGQSGEPFRHHFRKKLELSPDQELDLNSISSDYVAKATLIQTEIAAVIRTFRQQYPGGLMPKDQIPQAPPVILQTLELERSQLLQNGIDDLRIAFGESEFARTRQLARQQIVTNLHRVPLQSK